MRHTVSSVVAVEDLRQVVQTEAMRASQHLRYRILFESGVGSHLEVGGAEVVAEARDELRLAAVDVIACAILTGARRERLVVLRLAAAKKRCSVMIVRFSITVEAKRDEDEKRQRDAPTAPTKIRTAYLAGSKLCSLMSAGLQSDLHMGEMPRFSQHSM